MNGVLSLMLIMQDLSYTPALREFESVQPILCLRISKSIQVFGFLLVLLCKQDHSAKAIFCVGGHHQLRAKFLAEITYDFGYKNFCAVFSGHDNNILLAVCGGQFIRSN
jgi:hypothetical protein